MLRELPRGPFGAYLHAHYRRVPGAVSRFAMGCGAIFMIQRVRPQLESLIERGAIAETDPLLLDEMVALVVEQGLDVVPLAEVRRRLAARETVRRFVSFTFDGAYRTTIEHALPLFRKRGLPFAVFAAGDFLGGDQVPWWMALEALVSRSDSLRLIRDHRVHEVACVGEGQKRACFAALFREVSQMPGQARGPHVAQLCAKHNVDLASVAARELLSGEELRALAADGDVTVGCQPGNVRPLAEMSFDEARDSLTQSLDRMEAVLGARPRHIAYPGTVAASAGAREFRMAAAAGMETAVTAVEGALWPEHASELFALPCIALDNDPATLVRALMLSGGATYGAGMTAIARATA